MDRDEYLELTDWRRRVASLFETWRAASTSDPERATAWFRKAKDRLFAEHPQSPLMPEGREGFEGLPYWPYDPKWRMTVRLERDEATGGPNEESEQSGAGAAGAASLGGGSPVGGGSSLGGGSPVGGGGPPRMSLAGLSGPIALPNSGSGAISFRRIGHVVLEGPLAGQSLGIFWIDAYGGGLFLPFRDATAGTETYGAGRYLLDTIKSADHGGDFRSGTLLLDFNLAFHPSCAYDPRWSCPLAPVENHLHVPVPVGERLGAARH